MKITLRELVRNLPPVPKWYFLFNTIMFFMVCAWSLIVWHAYGLAVLTGLSSLFAAHAIKYGT